MKRLIAPTLWLVSAITALISISSVALWMYSFTTPCKISFTRFHESFDFACDSRSITLHAESLVPSSVNSTGLNGLTLIAINGNRLSIRYSRILVGILPSGPATVLNSVFVTTTEFHRFGLGWSGGFTAKTVTLPGPITVNRFNTFNITYADVWIASGIILIVTYVFLRRYRKESPAGFCFHCGYDLRATPDRCPECGTIPASSLIQSQKSPLNS